jgi:benzoate-CoA ligase
MLKRLHAPSSPRRFFESQCAEPVNLAEHLLDRHVREGRGERTMLWYQSSRFTYAEVADLTSRAASVLRDLGVCEQDRVLLLLPDTPAFVGAFFGALALGGIVVPLSPALTPDDVLFVTAHTEARIAIVDERIADKFSTLRSVPTLSELVLAGDCAGVRSTWERALDTAEPRSNPTKPVRGDLAYCLFSSGTTGRPKGVVHRHADILHCARAYALPELEMNERDVILSIPKLSFGYGLGGNLLFGALVGASCILEDEPSSATKVCALAIRHSPTVLLAQPRMIAEVLELNPPPETFSHLRCCISAGENLPPSLAERWMGRFGTEVLDGYGSTEMGHIFISSRRGDFRAGSVGRVLRDYDVRIVDERGEPIPRGEVGELWARGPSLAPFYWNDSRRTKEAFRDGGWFATGDLFSQDAEGYLYPRGRIDELIKVGCGEWVSPGEIEEVLSRHAAVADSAVVAGSDPNGITRLKAYVVLRPESVPSESLEEELKERVRQEWPDLHHKRLSLVEFASALPRTVNGKLQRFKLSQQSAIGFSYDC